MEPTGNLGPEDGLVILWTWEYIAGKRCDVILWLGRERILAAMTAQVSRLFLATCVGWVLTHYNYMGKRKNSKQDLGIECPMKYLNESCLSWNRLVFVQRISCLNKILSNKKNNVCIKVMLQLVYVLMCTPSLQSSLILCDPMGCSPPGSSGSGIL